MILQTLFPGLWLSEITADMYKVNENPEPAKVILFHHPKSILVSFISLNFEEIFYLLIIGVVLGLQLLDPPNPDAPFSRPE